MQFENGEYYHIYNRGVEKRDIFLCRGDYERFLKSMQEFNNSLLHEQRIYFKNRYSHSEGKSEFNSEASELNSEKLVEIICYCLNSNHFHLILKQLIERGIEKFMQKIGTGYTNYFNLKYKRVGSLFQGRYKAKHIDEDENLLWLSAYVNCNAQIHGLCKDAKEYPWSSYKEFFSKSKKGICDKEIVTSQFKNIEDYRRFMNEVLPIIKENKKLEKYLMD